MFSKAKPTCWTSRNYSTLPKQIRAFPDSMQVKKVTKRGSKTCEEQAYLASGLCGLRKEISPRPKRIQQEKSEGSPHKVAMSARPNKALHHVYAMLKKGQPFASEELLIHRLLQVGAYALNTVFQKSPTTLFLIINSFFTIIF